jgi:hypothetical protein
MDATSKSPKNLLLYRSKCFLEFRRLGTVPPKRYRHYKGNAYTVLGMARPSETLEDLVVYRQEYGERGLRCASAAEVPGARERQRGGPSPLAAPS